jgi:carbon storage regulator
MLVLSRRTGERIVIGEGAARITLTVVGIERGKVRLAVEAPRSVAVWREEILPADHPLRRPPAAPESQS